MTKTRKRHQKTEYEKQRNDHRNKTQRHVVTFEAKLTPDQIQEILKINRTVAYIGRRVTAEARKRLEQLNRRNDYPILQDEYAKIKKKQEDNEICQITADGSTSRNSPIFRITTGQSI